MHSLTIIAADSQPQAEAMLQPYDENLTVEPRIDATPDEWIPQEREWRASYAAKFNNEAAERYARQTKLDDEEFARSIIEEGDYDYDDDGNRITTCNPDGMWDWYIPGGRWEDTVKRWQGAPIDDYTASLYSTTDGDVPLPYYVLTDNGWETYENDGQLRDILSRADGQYIWFYDIHS